MENVWVWMKPPDGGEPQQVDATPEILTPLMVKGWSQCEPPAVESESEPLPALSLPKGPSESGPMEGDHDAS